MSIWYPYPIPHSYFPDIFCTQDPRRQKFCTTWPQKDSRSRTNYETWRNSIHNQQFQTYWKGSDSLVSSAQSMSWDMAPYLDLENFMAVSAWNDLKRLWRTEGIAESSWTLNTTWKTNTFGMPQKLLKDRWTKTWDQGNWPNPHSNISHKGS